MNNKDIIKTTNTNKVSKYSSDLIVRGLSLAVLVKKNDNKHNLETLLQKGVNLYENLEYQEALNILDKIISLNPNYSNLEFWETRAKSLSKLQRYQESVKSFYKILEIEEDVDYLYDLLLEEADELCYEEKHREALIFYEAAVIVKPHESFAYYSQGITQFTLGLYEEAVESFNKYIAIEVNDYDIWPWLPDALHQLGRYEEELLAYEKLIQVDSNKSYLWTGKANTLYKLNQYLDAFEAYNKGIELGSNHAWIWLERGDVLDKLQRHEEASSSYSQASSLDLVYTQILHQENLI